MRKYTLHPDTRIAIALALFIIGLISFVTMSMAQQEQKKNTRGSACTEEAKVCSDGSTVSRTGPACAFAACPNNNRPIHPGITEEPLEVPVLPMPKKKGSGNEKMMCTDEVKVCPDGSFVGKTGPQCQFAPCPLFDPEFEGDL